MINKLISIVIAALIISIACSDTPTVSSTAQLTLYLQISQAEYDSVYVVFDSVYAISAGNSSERTLIDLGPDTLEASDYRNGRNYQLAEVMLRAAEFSGIEIVFYTGRIVVNGISDYLVPAEGNLTSGIANGTVTVSLNQDNEALIDLNLFESISYNASTGNYEFQPILKVIDPEQTGSITGQTSPVARIYLSDSSSEYPVGFTISDGDDLSFGFYGLDTGFYNLVYSPIGDDTLSFGSSYSYNVPVDPNDNFDVGLLTLPQP